MSDKFFSQYNENFKGLEDIPGFSLNVPYWPGVVPGDVGVEIELEGQRLPSQGYLEKTVGPETSSFWRVERDGSLRNGGLEYVLNTPANIGEIPLLVDGLWSVFSQLKTKIEVSNRCSTHVHVNMSNRKINEITAVIALWMVFEEALISWNGEMRKTNHFCLSTNDSPTLSKGWLNFLETGKRPASEDTYKYASLNVAALSKYGSLEFRCGRGASNPETVKNWTKFLYYMCKHAMVTYSNPKTLTYHLSEEGGMGIFERICRQANLPDFCQEVIDSVPDFNRSCIAGFRNAQPFVMGVSWEKWLDKINSEYIPHPFAKEGRAVPRNSQNGLINPIPAAIALRPLLDVDWAVIRDEQ